MYIAFILCLSACNGITDNLSGMAFTEPADSVKQAKNEAVLNKGSADGETNMGSGWSVLTRIPYKIRKDVVFVILNTKSQIMRIIPQIMAQGVPLKNILGINTLTYNNN